MTLELMMAGAGSLLLEVCIASADDALSAFRGGADRIELNSALQLGGLTPTPGLLREVKGAVDLPIIAMVRPRPGGFAYTMRELNVMKSDAASLMAAGADGIAFGMLTPDRDIDVPACRALLREVGGGAAVFHRAFDFVRSPEGALDVLIDLGVRRVLTSGQRSTALIGTERISRLIEAAGARIEILPAGGIRSENIGDLLDRCPCNQVHGSFAKACGTASGDSPDGVRLGAAAEAPLSATDAEEVIRVRRLLDEWPRSESTND